MAGSRFGKNYDRDTLVAPVLVEEEVLEVLAHAVGMQGAPAQALQDLRARRARGEAVACLVDEGCFYVVPCEALPSGLVSKPETP